MKLSNLVLSLVFTTGIMASTATGGLRGLESEDTESSDDEEVLYRIVTAGPDRIGGGDDNGPYFIYAEEYEDNDAKGIFVDPQFNADGTGVEWTVIADIKCVQTIDFEGGLASFVGGVITDDDGIGDLFKLAIQDEPFFTIVFDGPVTNKATGFWPTSFLAFDNSGAKANKKFWEDFYEPEQPDFSCGALKDKGFFDTSGSNVRDLIKALDEGPQSQWTEIFNVQIKAMS